MTKRGTERDTIIEAEVWRVLAVTATHDVQDEERGKRHRLSPFAQALDERAVELEKRFRHAENRRLVKEGRV